GHGKEPTPKRAFLGIVLQPARCLSDSSQHVLSYLGRVGILKSPFADKPIHQRGVDIHKPGPILFVLRIANAKEQTRLCRRCQSHWPVSLLTSTWVDGKPFSVDQFFLWSAAIDRRVILHAVTNEISTLTRSASEGAWTYPRLRFG